jgi:hypothetical protein
MSTALVARIGARCFVVVETHQSLKHNNANEASRCPTHSSLNANGVRCRLGQQHQRRKPAEQACNKAQHKLHRSMAQPAKRSEPAAKT